VSAQRTSNPRYADSNGLLDPGPVARLASRTCSPIRPRYADAAHLPTPSPPHAGNRLRLLPFRHRLTFREIWRAPTDAAAQSNVQ